MMRVQTKEICRSANKFKKKLRTHFKKGNIRLFILQPNKLTSLETNYKKISNIQGETQAQIQYVQEMKNCIWKNFFEYFICRIFYFLFIFKIMKSYILNYTKDDLININKEEQKL